MYSTSKSKAVVAVIPLNRKPEVSRPLVESSLLATGRSSFSDRETIIPAAMVRETPYMIVLEEVLRTSQPSSAPEEERGGRERERERNRERERKRNREKEREREKRNNATLR